MRKVIKIFDPLCLVHLFSLFGGALLLSLTQDRLLFKTDVFSLLHLILVLGFSLFLALAVPLLLAGVGTGFRGHRQFIDFMSIMVFAEMLFGFAIHYLDSSEVFNFTLKLLDSGGSPELVPEYARAPSFAGFAYAAGGVLLICLLSAYLVSRRVNLSHRILLLGRGSLGFAAVVLLILPWAGKMNWHDSNRASGKNLVLIVLDGMSTQFLKPYHANAKNSLFAEIAADGVLYTNIRTNLTYTYGYFYTLYSGNKDRWQGVPGKRSGGLLSALQDAGVNTRWIAYHNNGIPDVFNFQYRGLRSAFLTFKTAKYLGMFGLDYNIFINRSAGERGKSMGYREKAISQWLLWKGDGADPAPLLENEMVEEIRTLRNESRPFFALVHLPPDALASAGKTDKIQKMEQTPPASADDLERVQHKILQTQDYTYTEEDAWAAQAMRNRYQEQIEAGTRSLKNFLDILRQNRWDRDTLIMITADHGNIFSRGKVAYGFHNDEEVARVPFLILWNNRRGIEDRLGESIDIPQTILEFFGIDRKLSKNARSLLAEKEKSMTTTVTRWSSQRREWFLNVYKDGVRYVLNMFPGNVSVRREKFLDYFATVPAGQPLSLEDLDFDYKTVLADYGISEDVLTANPVSNKAP